MNRFFEILGIVAIVCGLCMITFGIGRLAELQNSKTKVEQIRNEVKNCKVGNICYIKSLDLTLPLIVAKVK